MKSTTRGNKSKEEFLWIPGILAERPELDWSIKPIVALAYSYSREGGQGLLLDNRQLSTFLGIGPRAVQRLIKRAVQKKLLVISQNGKQRVIKPAGRVLRTEGIFIHDCHLKDPSLSWLERGTLGLIAGLSKKRGHCFASNNFLARQLGIDSRHVRRIIAQLISKGYVKATYPTKRQRHLTVIRKSAHKKQKDLLTSRKDDALDVHGGRPDGPPPPSSPSGGDVVDVRDPRPACPPIIHIEDTIEDNRNHRMNNVAFGNVLSLSEETTLGKASTGDQTTAACEGEAGSQSGDAADRPCDQNSSTSTTQYQSSNDHSTDDWKPYWNPLTDRKWQIKKLLGLIRLSFRNMRAAGMFPKHYQLELDEKELIQWLDDNIPQIMCYNSGTLGLSSTAGEFITLLRRSWYGSNQPIEKDKYNPWACCRGTNGLGNFLKRYEQIKKALEEEWPIDERIDKYSGGKVFTILARQLMRHPWYYKWRTRGDPLMEVPPKDILDHEELEAQRWRLKYWIGRFQSTKQREPNKTQAELALTSRYESFKHAIKESTARLSPNLPNTSAAAFLTS